MPDIGVPQYIPSATASIQDIDLSTALNRTPNLGTSSITPKSVDPGLNTAIPFNFDNKQYGKPLRVFDEKPLNSVAGYNSFKEDPKFNPEFSDMQNIRDYASRQGTAEWLGNNFAKLGHIAGDSFISAFEQNGRNFQALSSLDTSKLFDHTDNTAKQELLRDMYPTYGTGELDNSLSRFVPWNFGKSDFGGEMISQLGFTVGTMGETLLENWLIGMATGGVGNVVEGAKTLSSFGKVGKGLVDLFEMGSGITNFRKGLAVLNTIKNEGTIGASLGQGVIKGAKMLANAYAMFNTAGGEASFEANQAYHDQLANLKDDFRAKNGYAAFGEDLKKIEDSASKTATSVFGWNIPVLLGSNLIQFGNIMKPFKGVLAEGVEDVAMNLAGKGLGKSIETVAEKEITSTLGKIFNFSKRIAHHLAEPLSEGFEEVAQSTGQTFFGQYYKDIYNGLTPNTSLNNSVNSIFQYAGSKAFQDDFFGGFIGGAIFKGVGAIASKTGLQEKLGFDTDKKIADRKAALTDNALKILNSTSNEDLINYLFDPEVQNFISQNSNKQALVLAAESNDRLKFNDIKSKSVRDLIYSGLQTGKLNLALSKLDIFKELDNEDLAKSFNIQDKNDIDKAKTTASQLVENIKQRAYDLESDWNTINKTYSNPYPKDTALYKMYEEAKRDRLFSRDVVRDEQKRAADLRADVVMSSDVTDAVIDQAVDNDTLSKTIEDLSVFVKDAPDKNNVEYRRKETQLAILKEVEAEKARSKPDLSKIAQLIFGLGSTNKTTLDIGKDKEFNVQRIEDVLKLEERNKKNVAEYLFLTNQSIEESVQQHMQAANTVLDKVKTEAAKKVEETSEATPTSVAEDSEIADIVNTEENYKNWSNTGDKTDAQQFLDAINLGLSAFDKATPAQLAALTKADIDGMLSTNKAFANAEIRAKVVDALFDRFHPKPVETVTIEKPTPVQTEEQKQAEEDKNQGPLKLAKYKYANDKTPPSEYLSKGNPSDDQFHRRKDQFLENLHLQNLPKEGQKGKFWTKADVRVLIVTPNNAGKYGKNISSVLTNKFATSKTIDKLTPEEYKALDNASVMFLFVAQDGKDLKPINKDGKLLPALNGTSDYNVKDLIYTFNETSSPENYKGARFMQGDDLNKLIGLHRNQRLKWLTSQEDNLQPFEISHGLPNMQKKDGKAVRIQNTVQDTNHLPSDHIFEPEDLYISTSKDEFEKTDTNLVSQRYLRPGMPYLAIKDKSGNIVDYQRLENAKLTPSQKGSILYALKSLVDDYFANEQLVSLTDSNDNYNFVKHLLFLQEGNPYKDSASVKILQDPKAGTITIQYDFSGAQPKFLTFRKESDSNVLIDDTQFKTWLDNRYLNVRKPSPKKFTQIYVQDKKVKTREWDNYTQFLLDSKTPNGSSRDINEVPLKVETYTPAQQEGYYEGGNAFPTKRKQYYVKLGGKIVDEKANKVVNNQKPATATKSTPPVSTGNVMQDLAAILAANQKAAEAKKNPQPETSTGLKEFFEGGVNGMEQALKEVNAGSFWTQDKKSADSVAAKMGTGYEVVKVNKTIQPEGKPSFLAGGYSVRRKTVKTGDVLDQPTTTTSSTAYKVKDSKTPEGTTTGQKISLGSLLATPAQQVQEAVQEKAPVVENDTMSQLAAIMAANQAKAAAKKAGDKAITNEELFKVGNVINYNGQKVTITDNYLGVIKTKEAGILNVNGNDPDNYLLYQNGKDNSPTQVVDESPFDADEVAPDNSPEPENIISLRGKKKGGKLYPRGFTRINNYSKENIQEIKDYFKKNLPQVSVETVGQLIRLADGKLAWGTFSDGVVKIFEEAEAGTGYHEAFEAVFNGILTPREQENLLKEFGKRRGTFSNFSTEGNVSYKDATPEQAREEIAEEFLRFKLNGEVKEDTRNIFQKILDFILNFIRNLSSIQDVFSKLDRGFYANKELYNTGQVYNRLAGVGAIEEGQYLKGITYEMVSKLFQDTKSFTQFDESFNLDELYNGLFSQLNDFYNSDDEENPNTYKNVIADLYFPQIDAIENSPKFTEEYKAKLIRPLEIEFTKKLNAQRERFNTIIAFQWKQLIEDHKTYLKQLGVVNFVEAEVEDEGDQDNKNSNEYTKNEFKIDTKTTAPASIKLLFNTIAESTFNFEETQDMANGLSIPLIQPKLSNATGLVNLYDNGGQLFNIVLSQVSEINTIDGIKAKLEEMLGMDKIEDLQGNPEELNKYIQSRVDEEQYKNNSIYAHLFKIYTRVFATPENQLTEAEWKQRLKFLSTFSRQKPEFWQLVSGQDDTYLMDELRDSGRKKIISKWFYNFGGNIYDKKKTSLLNKQNKRNPFVLNSVVFNNLLGIADVNTFMIKTAEALGIEQVNANFIENLIDAERNSLNKNLRSILNNGFAKIFDGKVGNKIFNKLSPASLGVNSPFNEIAEIVLAKQGDEVHSVHSNIEGEQQQNIILNNEISNRLSSFNRHDTLDSYKIENPEFNDTFVQSSILLSKLYNRNGKRTSFKPTVAIVSGTRESNRDNGKKSSNQNLTERLYQEFNVNLDGKFYILLPADSETEWGINVGQNTYLEYKDNIRNNTATFVNYLKSEIEVAQQFVNPKHEFHENRTGNEYLSQSRPLRDGSERKVGASLQVFKDILSDELVAAIHKNVDSLSPVEDIITQYEFEINRDIKIWVDKRVQETFVNLNRAEILERKDRKPGEYDNAIQANSQYVFYGLNSSFNRDVTKFPLNEGEVKRGKNVSIEKLPNQYVLTSAQLRNLIAFREMSYAINNIEMTKLFVGNPYFYKDIQKRVKSFLSTTENTYVQNVGDMHKADNWFNSHLNSAKFTNKKKETIEQRLPSSHLHNHTFSSSMKTWVFRDHETLNKELADFNKKYAANNATDAQSYITPNAYREFYWKSGAKFRDAQEKQFQVEQAFERFLLDEDGLYPYTSSELKAIDQKILEGHVKETANGYELTAKFDVFEVYKPKGSGALGGLNTFEPFIWKTSVAMMNYRMVRNTPLEKAYLKMLNEGVHLLTFESAIKVGLKKDPTTGKVNNLIDTESFSNLGRVSNNLSSFTHELPFKSVGIQVETSGQKNKGTIGTQTTKLILTDLFEYGIPTDFNAGDDFGSRMAEWHYFSEDEKLTASKHYSLEKEHQRAIENLENVGYNKLLDRLGIKEVTKNGRNEYEYEDLSKVYQLLKEEMVKRGLSSNLYDMFDDMTLKVKPIEALSNYAQASFIIMSVVRKSIIKPKLNGGQKIQASSVLLNDLTDENLKASVYDAKTKKWIDLETEEQFNEAKKSGGKIMYNSSQLGFYSKNEDGTMNVMEIMLPNVFRDKLTKARKAKGLEQLSDDELFTWIAKNQPELLEGIGFRIPTQALSSIDTFKIKKFLPSYFGDTVIVPSELTTKVGSDFDVDKLNTYLKNFTINSKGYPEYVKPYSSIEEARAKFRASYKAGKKNALKTSQRLLSALDAFIQYNESGEDAKIEDYTSDRIARYVTKNQDFLTSVLDKYDTDEDAIQAIMENIEELDMALSDSERAKILEEKYVNEKVTKSLENNYFSIIDQILKLPQNFEKMLAPNNSDEFEKAGALRDKIMDSLGGNKDNLEKIPSDRRGKYINYSNILDSNRMRYNRWAFVIGKKGVGIAALSATNHVNSQKIGFQLNPSTQNNSAWWSNKVFGKDVTEPTLIKFKHNQLQFGDQKVTVLSGITKREGQNIAEFVSKYVNGYVDVAKDAWILDIGAQMELAGIYLLLERLGVNSEEIIYFLNQPIIKYYLNLASLKNSPIRNINPRVKEQVTAASSDEKIYDMVKKTLIGSQTIKPITEFKLTDLKGAIEKYSKIPISSWKTNSTISVRDKEQQFLVFRQFLQLKDYSNYIRSSQQASNHDTANLNSLHILDDKDSLLDSLANPFADNLITSIDKGLPMAVALREQTFVGNLYNKLDTLDRGFLSKDLFRIQAKHVRMYLREVMMKLNPSLFSENDKREMMDKITKVTINSLVLNTDLNNRGNLIDNLDTVMNADKLRDTIFKAQAILKNPDGNYKQQLKDANTDLATVISNKWINNLGVESIAPDSDFGYLTILGTKPSDNFEKQVWIEDFRKLKQLPFAQNLYKSILAASIYQAGAEHNRSSLLDLIPWQEYTPIINNGLNNLSLITDNHIVRAIAQLKAFDKSYFTPKDFIKAGEVNGVKYYANTISLIGKSKDEVVVSKPTNLYGAENPFATWIPATEHISVTGEKVTEISSLILVPFSAYQDKQQYFTLRQRSSSFDNDEIKQMMEAKNFDFKTTILMEKAPMIFTDGLKTYLIYRPINTKGGRYVQEIDYTNEHSKLDTHEKVNPALTNDDVLYKLLNDKFGGKVKKTESFPETATTIVVEETDQDSNVTEDIPFEEVFDEAKELPSSQKLLEDSTPEGGRILDPNETPTRDITDTEAGRNFVDKTMRGGFSEFLNDLYSPDDMPIIDKENQVEGSCE